MTPTIPGRKYSYEIEFGTRSKSMLNSCQDLWQNQLRNWGVFCMSVGYPVNVILSDDAHSDAEYESNPLMLYKLVILDVQ